MKRAALAVPALLSLVLAATTAAAELEGRVVKIADGDTLSILVDGRQEKVRLSDIDTPERRQPYGKRARQALAELTFGKTIVVRTSTRDRYGRIIGRVTVDALDVNAELVRLGYAWVYRRYSDDPELIRLEQLARADGLGLWAESDPIPPWEWRRGRRPSQDRGALFAD